MATPVARLAVKVSPKASRNAIVGWLGDVLKLSVTAAPERGKANEAVEELLAEALNLAKSRVSVVSGRTQSRKLVLVEGLSDSALRARLSPGN